MDTIPTVVKIALWVQVAAAVIYLAPLPWTVSWLLEAKDDRDFEGVFLARRRLLNSAIAFAAVIVVPWLGIGLFRCFQWLFQPM